MKIDCFDIDIIFPKQPEQIWKHLNCEWESYRILAKYDGTQIGHLTINRLSKNFGNNDLDKDVFYDTSIKPFYTSLDENNSRPFVSYRFTDDDYRGNGLQRKLILCANDFCIENFSAPIHSGGNYNPDFIKRILGTWEHLVEDGLAFKYSQGKLIKYGMQNKSL